MNYYYLNGLEKIGPLTIDELKQSPIKDDTLIWYEGLTEWTKLSDLHDLKKNIISVVVNNPPPIPVEIINKEEKINNNKNLRTIILIFISFIIIGFCIFISYSKANSQIEKDYKVIERIVENVFQGKSAVCDGIFFPVIGNKKKVKINKIKINGEFGIPYSDLFKYGTNQIESIKEEFKLSEGGFNIYKISREDKGYVLKKTVAGNMIYKVGEFEQFYGRLLPSYRPSVSSCYLFAFKDLTENQKDGSYIPNSYDKILTFDKIKSEFYQICNEKGIRIHSSHWWQDNVGLIYEQFAVYFRNDFWYYEIKPIKSEISKKYNSYIINGLLIGFMIAFIFNLIVYLIRKYY